MKWTLFLISLCFLIYSSNEATITPIDGGITTSDVSAMQRDAIYTLTFSVDLDITNDYDLLVDFPNQYYLIVDPICEVTTYLGTYSSSCYLVEIPSSSSGALNRLRIPELAYDQPQLDSDQEIQIVVSGIKNPARSGKTGPFQFSLVASGGSYPIGESTLLSSVAIIGPRFSFDNLSVGVGGTQPNVQGGSVKFTLTAKSYAKLLVGQKMRFQVDTSIFTYRTDVTGTYVMKSTSPSTISTTPTISSDKSYIEGFGTVEIPMNSEYEIEFGSFYNPMEPYTSAVFKLMIVEDDVIRSYGETTLSSTFTNNAEHSNWQSSKSADFPFVTDCDMTVAISMTLAVSLPKYSMIEIYCSVCDFIPASSYVASGLSPISYEYPILFHNQGITGALATTYDRNYLVIERFDDVDAGETLDIITRFKATSVMATVQPNVYTFVPGDPISYRISDVIVQPLLTVESYLGDGSIVSLSSSNSRIDRILISNPDLASPSFFYEKGTTGASLQIDMPGTPGGAISGRIQTLTSGYFTSYSTTLSSSPAAISTQTLHANYIEFSTTQFPTTLTISAFPDLTDSAGIQDTRIEFMLQIDTYYRYFHLPITTLSPFSIDEADDDCLIYDPIKEENEVSPITFRFWTPVGQIVFYFPNYDPINDITLTYDWDSSLESGDEIPCSISTSIPLENWPQRKCRFYKEKESTPPHEFLMSTHIAVEPPFEEYSSTDYVTVGLSLTNPTVTTTGSFYIIGGVESVDHITGLRNPYKYFEYERTVVDALGLTETITSYSYSSISDKDDNLYTTFQPQQLSSLKLEIELSATVATQDVALIYLPWVVTDGTNEVVCSIGADILFLEEVTTKVMRNMPTTGSSIIILEDYASIEPFVDSVKYLVCEDVLTPGYASALSDTKIQIYIVDSSGAIVVSAPTYTQFPFDYRLDSTCTTPNMEFALASSSTYISDPDAILTISLTIPNLHYAANRFLSVHYDSSIFQAEYNECSIASENSVSGKNLCSVIDANNLVISNFWWYDSGTVDIEVTNFINPSASLTGSGWEILLYESDSEEDKDFIGCTPDTPSTGLTVTSTIPVNSITIGSFTIDPQVADAVSDITFTLTFANNVEAETVLKMTLGNNYDSVNYRDRVVINCVDSSSKKVVIKDVEITTSSPNEISITFADQLSLAETYYFSFYNMENPTSSTGAITFELIRKESILGSYTVSSLSMSALTSTITSASALAYKRNEGILSDYLIVFKTPASLSLSSGHIITIEFPKNYPKSLFSDSSNVECSSAELETKSEKMTCNYQTLRKVQVSSIKSLDPEKVATIRLRNIQNPKAEQLNKFSISISFPDPSTVVAFGEFEGDTIVESSYNLNILDVTTNNECSMVHDWTVSFKTGVNLKDQYHIYFQFPTEFVLDFVETVTVELVPTSGSNTACSFSFYKLSNAIYLRNLESDCRKSSANLEVTLSRITNPEEEGYASTPVFVGVMDTRTKKVLSQSHHQFNQALHQEYVKSLSEIWTVDQNGLTYLAAYPGIESSAINVAISDINSAAQIEVMPVLDNRNTISPETIILTSTTLSSSFTITSNPLYKSPEIHTIKWKLITAGDHTVPPKMELNMEESKIRIQFPDFDGALPVGAYSKPFTISLDQPCPREFVFENNPDSRIIVATNLIIPYGETEGTFQVKSTESAATGAATLQLTIPEKLEHLFDFDSGGTNQALTFTIQDTSSPEISSFTVLQEGRNQVDVEVETTHVGILYYQISLSGLRETMDLDTIQQFLIELPFDVCLRNGKWNDLHASVYGKHKTERLNSQFTLMNIAGGRNYEINFYLQTESGSVSSVYTGYFSTSDITSTVRLNLDIGKTTMITVTDFENIKTGLATLFQTNTDCVELQTVKFPVDDVERSTVVRLENLYLSDYLYAFILPDGLLPDSTLDPVNLVDTISLTDIQSAFDNNGVEFLPTDFSWAIYDDSPPTIDSLSPDLDYYNINITVQAEHEGVVAAVMQEAELSQPTALQILLRRNASGQTPLASWKWNVTYNASGDVLKDQIVVFKEKFQFGGLYEDTSYEFFFTSRVPFSPTGKVLTPIVVQTEKTLGLGGLNSAPSMMLLILIVFGFMIL